MKTDTAPVGGVGSGPNEPARPTGRRRLHLYVTWPFLAALLTVSLSCLIAANRREPDVYTSLETIGSGNPRARWRAAGALARALTDPARVPEDQAFADALLGQFQNDSLETIDHRIHLYLGLAMGRVGDPRFFTPLLEALEASPPATEDRAVYVRALGLMQDDRAVPALLPLLASNHTAVRHETVQALGHIGGGAAREALRAMLDDREANVQWDAAVGLAKMGDDAGKDILLNLLDRDYYAGFPEVRDEGCAWAMEAAVRASIRLQDPDINDRIKELATTDPNLRVRGVALELLKAHGIEA